MNNRDRQLVRGARIEKWESVDIEYRTADEVIKMMEEYKERYKDLQNVRIESNCWDDSNELYFVHDRYETDEEYNKRLDAIAAHEARELQQYEELKKKYGS